MISPSPWRLRADLCGQHEGDHRRARGSGTPPSMCHRGPSGGVYDGPAATRGETRSYPPQESPERLAHTHSADRGALLDENGAQIYPIQGPRSRFRPASTPTRPSVRPSKSYCLRLAGAHHLRSAAPAAGAVCVSVRVVGDPSGHVVHLVCVVTPGRTSKEISLCRDEMSSIRIQMHMPVM